MAAHKNCDGSIRRDFLKVGALGFSGLSLGSYLNMTSAGTISKLARAKAAIFVNLNGGPSHMDTFDLKPNAPSEYRGEFKPIETAVPGIQISEHLPKLAAAMKHFTILRGVSHTLAAHELGTEYVNTGNRPLPSLEFPGYGAVIAKELACPPDLPPSISIPNSKQRAGYIGVQYAPLHTGSTPKSASEAYSVRGIRLSNGLTIADVEDRYSLLSKLDNTLSSLDNKNSLLQGMDKFSQQALQMITSPKARAAFDISKESPAFAQKFGSNQFGLSCMLATRLVESGVPFVTITNGGWDTHKDNWTNLKTRLLPPLDEALSGLFVGLHEKGLLDSTVVLVTGEFGRTPKINTERNGRDHYPRNMFMLMSGGGISGGRVLGESDDTASLPKTKGFSPDDVAATYFHALGIDHTKEFHTPTGRPVMIVRDGHIINDLFA
jgi:hypothetical protein